MSYLLLCEKPESVPPPKSALLHGSVQSLVGNPLRLETSHVLGMESCLSSKFTSILAVVKHDLQDVLWVLVDHFISRGRVPMVYHIRNQPVQIQLGHQ